MSDDQKAMLRLLAQREEGYEDMAKLMGISVEEVRERVKEALAEVDESGATPEPVNEQPAPAPAAPQPSPPATEKPAPPPAPAPAPVAPAPATPKPSRSRQALFPSLKLPKDRGALIGLGAGVLVFIALAIVLALSSGGDDDSNSTANGNQEANLSAAEERNLTQAVLVPTGDTDASGRALFGRSGKKVLLQVEAEGLEPSPAGQSYTVWLYRSPKLALQIGAVRVEDSGELAAQFQIPAQLLTYVANGAFDQVDVSLTSIAEYKAAFNKAKSENKVPPYVGESVLRGEITGPAIKQQQSGE